MYRRFSLVFWVTLKLILVVVITHGYCTGAPDVTADAAVVLDARTGSILYGRWPYEQRPPASTTKILTAIIALEKGRLSDIVTASPNASYTEGSQYLFTARGKAYVRRANLGCFTGVGK